MEGVQMKNKKGISFRKQKKLSPYKLTLSFADSQCAIENREKNLSLNRHQKAKYTDEKICRQLAVAQAQQND